MKKILIVDDEPDVVAYISVVLESNGYKPYSSRDIKTAMQKVKEINPDLICLDIVMPNETGISFYIKLKQNEKFNKIPVIIISGIIEFEKFDFRAYVKDTTIPEPERFMEKPIDVKKFVQNIKNLTQ
jgi:CheY-like chemotaxis protein